MHSESPFFFCPACFSDLEEQNIPYMLLENICEKYINGNITYAEIGTENIGRIRTLSKRLENKRLIVTHETDALIFLRPNLYYVENPEGKKVWLLCSRPNVHCNIESTC